MRAQQLLHSALVLVCLAVFAGCETNFPSTPAPSATTKHCTYVIVHGAWGGGWDWKHVADLLAADGNTVYRPTLSGLGEHVNLSSTNIDLDTHIQDIVNVMLWENLHDVVLVGHSYGGMVITGVADRVPDRIRRMVYVDALLPTNGECVNDILPSRFKQPVVNGFVIPTWVTGNPPPPHDVPQPALTFSEPITLTNQTVAGKLPATYILCVEKGQSLNQANYYPFYERAKARGWTTAIMAGDHNVQRSHPRELARLLEPAP
jgi:pimeloyl-ACP methyl ester carboxylesterase